MWYRVKVGGLAFLFSDKRPQSAKKNVYFNFFLFSAAMEDLKKQRGEELSYPVLAFHGTQEKNIKLIVENNFTVPGNV